MINEEVTRRRVLKMLGLFTSAPPFAEAAQQLAGEPLGRITPVSEIINSFEFELMAKRKLSDAAFSTIAGGNREDIERCTFRPQLMVDTTGLSLSTELFGQTMFAPILVGPASSQQKIHPEGELAMVKGASAAKAITVISSHSSYPIAEIVAMAAKEKGSIWYQAFAEEKADQAQKAVQLGCQIVVVSVKTGQKPDWSAVDRWRKNIAVPIVLKGVASEADAESAVKHGMQGIVVSNYGRPTSPSSFAMLPSIVDAIGGKIPVLIDGGFRRGTDILKALILGAQAVLITRPPLWGLAAYGAGGVQAVVEMMQTELARNMIMIGAATPKALKRSMLKIHQP